MPVGAPVGAHADPNAWSPAAVQVTANSPTHAAFGVGYESTGGESPGIGRRKKKVSPLMLTAVLGGAALVVAIVGLAIVLTRENGETPVAQSAGESAIPATSTSASSDDNVDPEAAWNAATASGDQARQIDATSAAVPSPVRAEQPPGASPRPSVPREFSPAELARMNEVANDVARWFDGASGGKLSMPNVMQLQVIAAWLEPESVVGATSAGTPDASPDNPADPLGNETPVAASPPAIPSQSGGTQRLFVQLQLTNVAADKVLAYSSWNGSGEFGDKCRAVLDDGAGRFARLLSNKEAPSEERLANVALQPNQSIQDLLVFEVTGEVPEKYRLALPRAAFGRTQSIGFELPQVMLRKPIPVDTTAESTGAAAEDPAATRRPPSNPNSATNSNTGSPTANTTQPPGPSTPAPPESETPPAEPKAIVNGNQPDDIKGLLDSIKSSKTDQKNP